MTISVNILRVTNLLFVNYCYLVINNNTNTSVLIDPAWEQNKIEESILNSQSNLVGILLTHHHSDHINLAAAFAQKYQIPVYMSRVEIDFYHFQCPNLIAIDTFDVFDLHGIQIHPLFTPGHTIGGTSYLIATNLFSGDTLFIEGCGICSGNGGDAGVMFDTLQMLKKRISPNTLIYPGHSYGQRVGKPLAYLLKNNIYLMFTDKNKFIKFRMRPNQNNLFSFK